LRDINPSEVNDVGAALIAAGITNFEIPMSSVNPLDSIKRLARTFGAHSQVGGGIATERFHADRIASAGGQMVLSPHCDPVVIERALQLDLTVYAGVFTATDCFKAIRAGATNLMFFPAVQIGLKGFQSLVQVLPQNIRYYACGGVDGSEFVTWLSAGMHGFVLGAVLYQPNRTIHEIALRAGAVVHSYDQASKRVKTQ
jgi:2-dehydro-3-deoxyphosphogalactonate aldolase